MSGFPVDFGRMLLEQVGAQVRFGERFDGAVAGLFGRHDDGLMPGLFERRDHLRAAALRQVSGKKSTVADDHAEGHAAKSNFCHYPFLPGLNFAI